MPQFEKVRDGLTSSANVIEADAASDVGLGTTFQGDYPEPTVSKRLPAAEFVDGSDEQSVNTLLCERSE
jgi:hypothetical protein